MPLISKQEIIEKIAIFEKDLENLKKHLNDPLVCDKHNRFKTRYNKIYACQKKIDRWLSYLKIVEETGRDYQYRFSKVSPNSSDSLNYPPNPRIFSRSGGRPKMYSEEVAIQRILEKRKVYNKKYYEQFILKKKSMDTLSHDTINTLKTD